MRFTPLILTKHMHTGLRRNIYILRLAPTAPYPYLNLQTHRSHKTSTSPQNVTSTTTCQQSTDQSAAAFMWDITQKIITSHLIITRKTMRSNHKTMHQVICPENVRLFHLRVILIVSTKQHIRLKYTATNRTPQTLYTLSSHRYSHLPDILFPLFLHTTSLSHQLLIHCPVLNVRIAIIIPNYIFSSISSIFFEALTPYESCDKDVLLYSKYLLFFSGPMPVLYAGVLFVANAKDNLVIV